MSENEIATIIIGQAITVHNALGPGLLESAYKECLYYKLSETGMFVEKEKPMPLTFEKINLDCGYRIDLLVEKKGNRIKKCRSIKRRAYCANINLYEAW